MPLLGDNARRAANVLPSLRAIFCGSLNRCLLRAVKPISRSQWNAGYCADSGPSRGDRRWHDIRPIEASKVAICYGRFTSTPALRCAQIALLTGDRTIPGPKLTPVGKAWTAPLATKKLARAQTGRARFSNVSVELCLGRVQIFSCLSSSRARFRYSARRGIVGEAVTGRRRVLDVLGIPQLAIITG